MTRPAAGSAPSNPPDSSAPRSTLNAASGQVSDPGSRRAADLLAELARPAGIRIRRDVPLAGYTTMRVGGPADLLAVAGDVPGLVALVQGARAAGVPFFLLGRGSDVVVADAGIRGLVVISRAEGWRIEADRLIAEAGLPLARAATLTQRAGLSGLEFGLAVPGTVGGAVWANAGAHGAEVAGVIESVAILGPDGAVATEPAAALRLAYRDSRFKRSSGDLILAATFRLTPADPVAIKARLDEIRRWRREHQPLSKASAGSVFRNPPGDSAGRLIDACGLRGARIGGAAISPKHANFIVNEGGATASEIRRLAELARSSVAAAFGVELAYEVQFVGDWSGWVEE